MDTIDISASGGEFQNEGTLRVNTTTVSSDFTGELLTRTFCATPAHSPYFEPQLTSYELPERFTLTEKLERFLLARPETPFLAVDLDVVAAKYRELQNHFQSASIFYAVKANPERQIVALLAALGSSFDFASRSELELCLALGVDPSRLSYGNTIKKSADIAYAFSRGVRRFAFDSQAELNKLAAHAPGADVMCRIQTSGENAGWPLSRKFGCDLEMSAELLLMARGLGLNAIGVTFHVGSQQTDPRQWRNPLRETAALFRKLSHEGISLDTVNIGGGFPVPHEVKVPPIREFADAIDEALHDAFDSIRFDTSQLDAGARPLIGRGSGCHPE